MTFSPEQLNFFKFSKVVLDEFPVALRGVFASMWNIRIASPPSVPNWDDSFTCLKTFIAKEGGVEKVPNLNKSFKEWDCTALFRATLFAQTFAVPYGSGGVSTLAKLYVRPRGLSAGAFHPSVISPTGDQAETFALALNQLRLLRNSLCHQKNTRNIDKATFDYYIKLARDALTALGQDSTRIDEIGMMGEEDFPTAKQQQLEDALKKERDAAIQFKQIDDHLIKIESQVKDVGSDVKHVKTEVLSVKRKLEDVESEVKTGFTNVMTTMENVMSEGKKFKADVATQAECSKGPLFPDSCMPVKIPQFVGRQEESQAILDHLTNRETRLVDIWGPPGFGKTSVAINVAHRLKVMEIPVYFASLGGMKSKAELVSKLLSIFVDALKQTFHISDILPSHWLIQCLQQFQSPFVLILDNAEDLLEYGDPKQREDVLRFLEDVLAQCSNIKLLITSRESLHYLSYKLPIHQERVRELDGVSSVTLVRSLLSSVSDDDCSAIANVCGQVPLCIKMGCSLIRDGCFSVNELITKVKTSSLINALENEGSSVDVRVKTLINTTFERLSTPERNAFVSLAVFPGYFGVEEARTVWDLESNLSTKEMIRSLERRSLIDCGGNFGSFTLHRLFQSFIDERITIDQEDAATFEGAQLRFYNHYITAFGAITERFFENQSNEAFKAFLGQRENIISSLVNGARYDELYPFVVEVLSKAELFLYSVLLDEEDLFKKIYDTVAKEAEDRQNLSDDKRLLAAKSFRYWCWFSSGHQTWDLSQKSSGIGTTDFPAKLLCYHGVYQVLCGKLDEGISSLEFSVDLLSSRFDERVLKALVYQVLADSYHKKGERQKATHFQHLCSKESKATSTHIALCRGYPEDTCMVNFGQMRDDDVFFFLRLSRSFR